MEDRGQTKPQKRPKDTKTMQEDGKFSKYSINCPRDIAALKEGVIFQKSSSN